MGETWKKASESLSNISVSTNPNNAPVTIHGSSDDIRCIGIGTDAAVFQSIHAPEYAFKLYAVEKTEKIAIEAGVYEKLGESCYFPTYYAHNDRFLVISFEEGITLSDCLLQGIHIPKQLVQDVEDAREYIRSRGLNPRDIHLKNILLQNGRAKILDVSEYALPGNDYRWEHLKKGYDEYYHIVDGRSVPLWILETVRKWYHQRNQHDQSFDDFIKSVSRIKTFWK